MRQYRWPDRAARLPTLHMGLPRYRSGRFRFLLLRDVWEHVRWPLSLCRCASLPRNFQFARSVANEGGTMHRTFYVLAMIREWGWLICWLYMVIAYVWRRSGVNRRRTERLSQTAYYGIGLGTAFVLFGLTSALPKVFLALVACFGTGWLVGLCLRRRWARGWQAYSAGESAPADTTVMSWGRSSGNRARDAYITIALLALIIAAGPASRVIMSVTRILIPLLTVFSGAYILGASTYLLLWTKRFERRTGTRTFIRLNG